MSDYLELLKEASGPDRNIKRVPWRSRTVTLDYAKTDIDGMSQDCLVLNNLKFVFTFKPSFMFIIPKIDRLQKVGGGTNGWLVTARKAQQLEYDIQESGTCYAKTFIFGRNKENRAFDIIQRMFETGFSIQNMDGLSIFPKNAVIDITASKDDYRNTSPITGRQITTKSLKQQQETGIKPKNNETKFLTPIRIKRVK